MIYKFETDKVNGTVYMEVKKVDEQVNISLISDKSAIEVEIFLSKEKLYDLIGSLHSIQSKLKK